MVRVRRCAAGHTTRDLGVLICPTPTCKLSLLNGFEELEDAEPTAAFVSLVLDFPWGPQEVGRSCGLGRSSEHCAFASQIVERDPNRYVGREHALIKLRNGEIVVEDLGSKNGTVVDGRPVPARGTVMAPSGAKVVLGGVLTVVVLGR